MEYHEVPVTRVTIHACTYVLRVLDEYSEGGWRVSKAQSHADGGNDNGVRGGVGGLSGRFLVRRLLHQLHQVGEVGLYRGGQHGVALNLKPQADKRT